MAAAEKDRISFVGGCRAAAIALHYLVLATFVWMAISAFNMYRAFVKVVQARGNRVFRTYSLIGWGKFLFYCRIDGVANMLLVI